MSTVDVDHADLFLVDGQDGRRSTSMTSAADFFSVDVRLMFSSRPNFLMFVVRVYFRKYSRPGSQYPTRQLGGVPTKLNNAYLPCKNKKLLFFK